MLSNSMIEAWWRTLKYQWLFLNVLDANRVDPRPQGAYAPATWPGHRGIMSLFAQSAIPKDEDE